MQQYLESWTLSLQQIVDLQLNDNYLLNDNNTKQYHNELLLFINSFVPYDLSQDDKNYFYEKLTNDYDYTKGILRDLQQCVSGNGVESIEGDQVTKAIFTLIPPLGTCELYYQLNIYEYIFNL